MPRKLTTLLRSLSFICAAACLPAAQPTDHLIFEGHPDKPGQNKHIVLIAGDEEYRSEEALPMLAQLLSYHGFKATVLFSMDKDGQFVDPTNTDSLSNSAALDSADAIILSIRWRTWSDKAMAHFHNAFERGIPIIALRTSTHPFKKRSGPYAKYGDGSGNKGEWDYGFGRHVIGEKWVAHHGRHAIEGCRTIVEADNRDHPILTGVDTIFCRSDVYTVNPRQPATILLSGEVTQTLEADSASVDSKNNPAMPVAWTREHRHDNGKVTKIFTTTMGSADDLTDINLRRLVLNSVYYNLGIAIPDVPTERFAQLQNTYKPTMFGFKDENDGLRKGPITGKTPSDYIHWISPKYDGPITESQTDNLIPQNEDELKQWTWVRPQPSGYRFAEGGLVLRNYPGNNWANNRPKGQNLLMRPFDRDNVAITLKLRFDTPDVQGDQAGMMFYYDDDHYIKIVREFMADRKETTILFVKEVSARGNIIERAASKPRTVELRFERRGDTIAAFYREPRQRDFKALKTDKLPRPSAEKPLQLCLFTSGARAEAKREAFFYTLSIEPLK